MISHPLFVHRKPELGKGKEVALASRARRLATSFMCVSLLLASAAATGDDASVPTQIVDLANKVDGAHPGFRAFHAKGVVVEGTFKASAEAARLSRATLFNGNSIPMTARFSDGSGMPTVPDGSPAMPRGIAIKYHLPGGTLPPVLSSPTIRCRACALPPMASRSGGAASRQAAGAGAVDRTHRGARRETPRLSSK